MNKTIYFGGPIITMEPDSTPSALLVERAAKSANLAKKRSFWPSAPMRSFTT